MKRERLNDGKHNEEFTRRTRNRVYVEVNKGENSSRNVLTYFQLFSSPFLAGEEEEDEKKKKKKNKKKRRKLFAMRIKLNGVNKMIVLSASSFSLPACHQQY
jgi:hypothetical protein